MSRLRRHLPLLVLMSPAVLVLGVLALYAVARVLIDSSFSVDYASGHRSFVGLANYRSVIADGEFGTSFVNTIQFTIVASIVEVVFGLALALLFVRAFPGGRIALRSPCCR
jgi:multiple sugar transport system permease protein